MTPDTAAPAAPPAPEVSDAPAVPVGTPPKPEPATPVALASDALVGAHEALKADYDKVLDAANKLADENKQLLGDNAQLREQLAAAQASVPAVQPRQTAAGQADPALTVGRIVHFSRTTGDHAPAVVTKVHNASMANLTVFTDTDGVQRIENAPLGTPGLPGTWHWPERA